MLIKLIKHFTGAKRDLYNISTSGATESQGGGKMAHRKKKKFTIRFFGLCICRLFVKEIGTSLQNIGTTNVSMFQFLFFTQQAVRSKLLCLTNTLQMKSRWESNINVWFRIMYSQKWNCSALLFPKQNYNVLFPNFHIHVSVSDLYLPMIGLPILLQPTRHIDRGNTHKLLPDTSIRELVTRLHSFFSGNT